MTEDLSPRKDTPERIAKVMARAGVASRREAERMIMEGRVAVNGEKISSPALDVLPTDRVTIDGKKMDAPQETKLWLYYKPLGLVTSESDEKGRQTVFDALPRDLPRVMTVGRLDLNSEGLLLLTNDGDLKRRLELPATGWLRRYRVRVNGTPNDLTFDPLRRGVTIEGEDFAPMEIKLDSQQGANAWLTVGIREGKNREIRRAMSHVGLQVNRLIRVGYGPFKLGALEKNEVSEVKRRVLRDQLGGLLTGEPEERPREMRPRGAEGDRPRRDGDRRDGFKPRGEGERREGFKPRGDGDRRDGFKPRGDGERREGFKPRGDGERREGFKPRGDGERREGFKPRGDGERREGFKPRGDGERREGFKPRREGDEGRPARKFGGKPDGDKGGFRPRRDGDSPGFKGRAGGDRPDFRKREDGDDRPARFGSKPDDARKPFKPKGDRPEGDRPRGDRPGKPGGFSGKPGGFAGKRGGFGEARGEDRGGNDRGGKPFGKGPRSEGSRDDGPHSKGPRSNAPRSDGPRSGAPRSNGPRSTGPKGNKPRG
ncbi:pseudouridine synthase [Paracoccus sp. 1_MG-2023]|uniref:pseudouridine synthase n=1 Tax=unclassified Paracoccus (in: a-proteobacteria) TaxID=2688777 RepID=UPI002091A66F|nr:MULTISPECIES: pseudouridine synthase [unclassified Paracoccus (in: a-proteobacteria)]MDO6669339.1 pseudouridine synthase [Paracoccus sp. 1_MG-2023]